MSLVVNNNLMAANTARNLNAHYGRLATSTQRLSSGLRINSAADDAAGLAIRELQRADIAALQQGARNANDAISMIQVADGSLGIIDEKLIRMKELAEQAATGTYDSTQRLMIESEYQAMASEITRIANATDFNGMKLLDGTLDGDHDGSGMVSTGKMKIHFGTGNDSAEDYYYITIGDCTAQAFGVGNASTWQDVQTRGINAVKDSLTKSIKNDSTLSDAEKGELLAQIPDAEAAIKNLFEAATDPLQAGKYWSDTEDAGKTWVGNSSLMSEYMAQYGMDAEAVLKSAFTEAAKGLDTSVVTGGVIDDTGAMSEAAVQAKFTTIGNNLKDTLLNAAKGLKLSDDVITKLETSIDTAIGAATMPAGGDDQKKVDGLVSDLVKDVITAASQTTLTADEEQAVKDAGMNKFWDGLRDSEKQKLQYAWGQAAVYNLANNKADGIYTNLDGDNLYAEIPTAFTGDHPEMLTTAFAAMQDKIGDMDFAGYTIETQEDAQHALDAINNAIVEKDKIRAHLGATQNRLENTVSNLNIQAENLQAAESRISDVDVATEMTQFVRNQILTQSAVAMLSQANSLPQMAMQLIGG